MRIKFSLCIIFTLLYPPESGGDTPRKYVNTFASDKEFFHERIYQTHNNNTDIVKKLPLVITHTKIQNKDMPAALLISGDGGWFGFEQSIADNLSNLGIPTIGLDSRKYFWKRRSPEETAKDISDMLNYYSDEWGRERFILVGYSLGSDIVPFIVNRLSKEMKSKIVSAVLLSPDQDTDFEVHFSNMLGIGNYHNTYNVLIEILKMQFVRTLIIYGEEEKSKVPELLIGTSVKVVQIPGDHHYKFNLALIIQTMKNNNVF
jgi:type IV secretory pathway VirJ component